MNDIKAIIFDFDDTLGNRDVYAYLFYEEFLNEFFNYLNDSPILKEAMLQDLMRWDQDGDCNKQYCFDRLAKKYNLTIPEFNTEQYYNGKIGKLTVLFYDANGVLKKLKDKYKLGILTNGTSYGQKGKLEHCLDLSLFDTVVISGDTPYKKPDKELFEIVVNKLNVQPSEALMVGDNFSNDVYGAINAGLKAVWICNKEYRLNRTDVKRIKNIKELLDLF